MCSLHAGAQTNAGQFIKRGVKLHDKADYRGAIEQFEKALAADPRSAQAMYELSLSYLALEDFQNSLKYSTKVINLNYKPLLTDAYIAKSSALGGLNKHAEAITMLKAAIQKYGDDYLLYYNLALNYSQTEDNKNALRCLEKAINEKVNYGEAYYLYAYTLGEENRWLEALFAFDTFLLLAPDDERAKEVFADATDILRNKLTEADAASENYPVPVPGTDMAKMRSLLQKVNAANPLKTMQEVDFAYFHESMQAVVSEVKTRYKESFTGMFWEYFVPTFTDILASGHFETFCRYISAPGIPASREWWKANQKKAYEFIDWFEKTNGLQEKSDEGHDTE